MSGPLAFCMSLCGPQNGAVRKGLRDVASLHGAISSSEPGNLFNQLVDIRERAVQFNQMVENRLDTTFHALADPTRRGMLANLALGEKSIGELAQPFAMSFAGASKHVKVLEDAGLVSRRKEGRVHWCSLNPEPLGEADRWLRQWEQFWSVRLDRLQALVEQGKVR